MPELSAAQIREVLFRVCRAYGVDPDIPREAQRYLRTLVGAYRGAATPPALAAWLEQQLPLHFVALGARPRWIRQPEWPFADNRPMVFVGQLDVSVEQHEAATQLFHDDTAFYLFIAATVPPRTIIQQY